MTMTRADDLAAARDYYDTHDTSDEMAQGTWVEAEPGYDSKAELAASSVVFSVRMPQPMLEAIRQHAARDGVSTGTLIRSWLEERLVAGQPELNQQLMVAISDLAAPLQVLARIAAAGQTRRQLPSGEPIVDPLSDVSPIDPVKGRV